MSHLTESQRSMIAGKLAKLKNGGDRGTVWGRVSFDLKHWDKELEEAKRNKIWLRHKPKYGSLEELLAKEVGFSDAEYEVKKKTQIRNLSEEHPDWTQQQIADEVGCSQPYVAQVISKTYESYDLVIPEHVKSKNDKADFRKLPHELQEQRAMIAGKLAKLKVGGDRRSEDFKVPIGTPSLEQAADMLNVGRLPSEFDQTTLFQTVPICSIFCSARKTFCTHQRSEQQSRHEHAKRTTRRPTDRASS